MTIVSQHPSITHEHLTALDSFFFFFFFLSFHRWPPVEARRTRAGSLSSNGYPTDRPPSLLFQWNMERSRLISRGIMFSDCHESISADLRPRSTFLIPPREANANYLSRYAVITID